MCAEMTKPYDDMIGLRQFLYICKSEKTHLNDKVVIGDLCVKRAIANQLQKKGASDLLYLEGN